MIGLKLPLHRRRLFRSFLHVKFNSAAVTFMELFVQPTGRSIHLERGTDLVGILQKSAVPMSHSYWAAAIKKGDEVRVSGLLGSAYLRNDHQGHMLCVAGEQRPPSTLYPSRIESRRNEKFNPRLFRSGRAAGPIRPAMATGPGGSKSEYSSSYYRELSHHQSIYSGRLGRVCGGEKLGRHARVARLPLRFFCDGGADYQSSDIQGCSTKAHLRRRLLTRHGVAKASGPDAKLADQNDN
jgi:hypothetical protein